MNTTCCAVNCQKPSKCKGWCSTHYERWRKNGTLQLKRAPNGAGWIDTNGYRRFQIGTGYQLPEHRLVMERILGRPLERWEHVHHINKNRLDNKPENLLVTTRYTHRKLHTKYFRNETHKECALCRNLLPRAEFYKRRRDTPDQDPHSFYCRPCARKQVRNYQPH